jgi:hypothetical protein
LLRFVNKSKVKDFLDFSVSNSVNTISGGGGLEIDKGGHNE